MELAGGRAMPMNEMRTVLSNIPPGDIRAVVPNITPDPETGIGRWTDAQIATAIREGRRPDGSIIGPPIIARQVGCPVSDSKDVRSLRVWKIA
jgi:hypothetical protein